MSVFIITKTKRSILLIQTENIDENVRFVDKWYVKCLKMTSDTKLTSDTLQINIYKFLYI